MIFVTSGSMLPFDRLFRLVDDAVAQGVIQDEVFGQIGESRYTPKHYAFSRFIDKETYDGYIEKASLVIAHAGIGVIIQALDSGTPLLVLPRQATLGEHVNDHQISTAERFEQLGHILTFDESSLAERLVAVKSFVPMRRAPNVAGVGNRIVSFLTELENRRSSA